MRSFLMSVVIAVVFAIGAVILLDGVVQQSAHEAYRTSAVRLADPGHNLVGEDWYAPTGG